MEQALKDAEAKYAAANRRIHHHNNVLAEKTKEIKAKLKKNLFILNNKQEEESQVKDKAKVAKAAADEANKETIDNLKNIDDIKSREKKLSKEMAEQQDAAMFMATR